MIHFYHEGPEPDLKEISENLSPEGVSLLCLYYVPSLVKRGTGHDGRSYSQRSWDAYQDDDEVVVQCSTLADAADACRALETRLRPFHVTITQEHSLVVIATT